MALAIALALASGSSAQSLLAFADSLRLAHGVPEIGYAVVSADEVIELQVIGLKQANTTRMAERMDRFRIGSNTKLVTAFIAARLVHQGRVAWTTRFFDLFPELLSESHAAYHQITLLDLLSFRAPLIPYTYTDAVPDTGRFTGDGAAQRYQFLRWALQQEPVAAADGVHFSNLSYVAAGAMLEKVTGRSYRQLVQELDTLLGLDLRFGAPNVEDSLATWGHDVNGLPDGPHPDIKLEWLLAAGNINANVSDFARFIQLHLQGLAGASDQLTAEEFRFLLFGRPTCALGWRWSTSADGSMRAFHTGNPGSFLTQVYLHAKSGRAYILFTNEQSPRTQEGLDALYAELVRRYDR